MSGQREVKRIESSDRKRCVEIIERSDGLFRFYEFQWTLLHVDGVAIIESSWNFVRMSGLYDSAEHAERDARAGLTWIESAGEEG